MNRRSGGSEDRMVGEKVKLRIVRTAHGPLCCLVRKDVSASGCRPSADGKLVRD